MKFLSHLRKEPKATVLSVLAMLLIFGLIFFGGMASWFGFKDVIGSIRR